MKFAFVSDNDDMKELVRYVSHLVAQESGNVLSEKQESMVVSRLSKRISDLDMDSSSYTKYLNHNLEKEKDVLISLLTTHYTFFFREFLQFEYLLKNLKNIVDKVKKRGDYKINILSLGCSKGHEVYSLAMFFKYHLKEFPGITFKVLGTDIDSECIRFAKNGVYSFSEIKTIPFAYMTGNWQRGVGEISEFVKIKPILKEHCEFEVLNILDLNKSLGIRKFDIIFCRNVFIYFDQKNIQQIVMNSLKHMEQDAIFVSGLSESLNSLEVDKLVLAPSVYSFNSTGKLLKPVVERELLSKSFIPSPIKMLIVDDSPSVVKILNKIFSDDPDFEVVATASNGVEAMNYLKINKVDAMTLDIHMPEMNGVEYLKNNFAKDHPKVVVVSSASREDQRYAQETLKYGASDFVEKPALNNLMERADEIKNKVKMSFLNDFEGQDHSINEIITKNYLIKNTSNLARFFILNYSDKLKLEKCLIDLKGNQPPIFIFFEGNLNYLETIKNDLKTNFIVSVYENDLIVEENTIYLCDFTRDFKLIFDHLLGRKISLSVFGILSKKVENTLVDLHYDRLQVLIEDNPEINKSAKEFITDIFPWTSFSHVGTEYLVDDKK